MSYEASLRLHVPSLRAYFHTVSADVQFNQFLFGANSLPCVWESLVTAFLVSSPYTLSHLTVIDWSEKWRNQIE
jgi:hypothetical protein